MEKENIPQCIFSILERIEELTKIDIQNKTLIELLACPAEELGELARELKIEFKTFGNSYKKPDEGSKAESCDLFIGAACMFFAEEKEKCLFAGSLEKYPIAADMSIQHSVWEEFENACKNLARCKGIQSFALAQNAINIFFKLGGTKEEFINTVNKKLDKWEKTQNL